MLEIHKRKKDFDFLMGKPMNELIPVPPQSWNQGGKGLGLLGRDWTHRCSQGNRNQASL